MVTYSSINYFSTSAQFVGCVSTYPRAAGPTTVLGRANGADLNTTTVTGPLTMWAQPFSVAYQQRDLALFTTTTSGSGASSPTSSGSASVTRSPTVSTASQTASPSPSGNSSAATASGSNSSSGGLSGGAIAGIAIGAAAVLGLIVGLAIFFAFRRRKEQRAAHDTGGTEASGAGTTNEKHGGATATQHWNGSQQYDPVAQYDHYAPEQQAPVEMPTFGYGKSIRRAEKPAEPIPQEMMATREPVELR